MSVLGLDIGTSTCKGIVLSCDGVVLAQKQVDYSHAVQVFGEAAEIDPSYFRDSVVEVVRALAKETAEDPIVSISVSSHGETMIPIGRDGKPLMNAMLSMDRRCEKQVELLKQRVGTEKIYYITGAMPHSQFPIPKIMWFQQEHPDLAACVENYDTASDYIHRCFGIPKVVDYSMACRIGGFDVHTRKWSDEILEAAEISIDQLSKPVCGGTPIGKIPPHIAADLGLSDGVTLVAGGHDQPCASIGMGIIDEQTITVSAGSYECAARASAQPANNKDGMRYGLNSYCHVLPDKYITLAFFVSGMMAKWYLDTFCNEEKKLAKAEGRSIFDYMESAFKDGPTGICVTPHIFGATNPEWNEKATAKITGVKASTTKADLYKAVLEGLSCELDLNIRVLERLTAPVQRLLMTGGGTRSAKWMQMRSDITGKVVDSVNNNAEASCMGAAILAGIGVGIFKDPADAHTRMRPDFRRYVPTQIEEYCEQKDMYLTLHCPWLMD